MLDLHLPAVRSFLALNSPALHLVDELAHETFVFAYRNLGQFSPGTSFRAWLRAIAWNLLRQEIQRFSRERLQEERWRDWQETHESHEPAPPLPAGEFLEQCLEELPHGFRELLRLKYREDRSTEEIAQLVRRSLAWVRTSLFRIRQQLRSCIENRAANDPT